MDYKGLIKSITQVCSVCCNLYGAVTYDDFLNIYTKYYPDNCLAYYDGYDNDEYVDYIVRYCGNGEYKYKNGVLCNIALKKDNPVLNFAAREPFPFYLPDEKDLNKWTNGEYTEPSPYLQLFTTVLSQAFDVNWGLNSIAADVNLACTDKTDHDEAVDDVIKVFRYHKLMHRNPNFSDVIIKAVQGYMLGGVRRWIYNGHTQYEVDKIRRER